MLYWVSLFVLGEILSRIIPIKWIGIGIFGVMAASRTACRLCRRRSKELEKQGNEDRIRRRILAIGFIFLMCGIILMQNAQSKSKESDWEEGTKVSFVGKIIKVEPERNGITYIVKAYEVQSEETAKGSTGNSVIHYVNIKIITKGQECLTLGSILEGHGKVKPFSRASNPGEYDEQSYQYGNGIYFALQEIEIRMVYAPVLPIREMLHRLQEHLCRVYTDVLSEKNASLAQAMVLGNRENLDAEIKQLYQRNGIAHLIAISGLHIAMIGGTLYRILRKWFGGYALPAGAGILFILLYGMMTGLSGATLRAVLMIIFSIGAELFGRRYDLSSAMAAALLFMLLQNPYQLTQAGFLLSFGAVAGITGIYPVWKKLWPDMPRCMEGLFVSISVQAVILPVMLYYFYEVPTYGIFLNVVVVPLMGILLAVLLVGGITGCFIPAAARIVMIPAQWIFKLYEGICNISETMPFHTICTGRPAVWWILLYYGGMLMFLALVYAEKVPSHEESRKRAVPFSILWIGAVGLFYGALMASFLMPLSLTVCIFDVGQGDGIYIRTPERTHILMDGGSSSKNKLGTYVLKNGLLFHGAKELDYVFISHSDRDHYSGIEELLDMDDITIKNIVLPAIANPDDAYLELQEKAKKRGCSLFYMKAGDFLEIDGIKLLCIHPECAEYKDKNTGSLVLCLSYGDFDMLLTGDMDEEAEQEVLNTIPDNAIEVLKVAHHGSATSSSKLFLERIQPDFACISVGEKNRYGHPAAEVMERLTAYAGKIYLTKDSGAITIETDGDIYRLKPFLTD